VWHGHATVELVVGGVRLITDPVLRGRVAHLRRHAPPVVLAPGPMDVVLLSHLHHDHLDLPSLRRLGRATPILVPRGSARLLARDGFTELDEVEPGDEVRIGAATIGVVPADHRGNRTFSKVKGPPLGFVVDGPEGRVYFPGDTDLFPGMADLPAPDLALLPIWGWGPAIGPGHLDPTRAAEAASVLRARAVLPVHWGTLAPLQPRVRPPAFLRVPGVRFAAALAERSPETTLHLLAPGGTVDIAP
jgi:L-ascorbate metabolism protein UlaG (beta-lactamase superfamily)